MPIRDKAIGWKRRRIFLHPIDFASQWLEDGTSKVMTGQGAGTPVFAALGVAASELTGIAIGAAGDEVYAFLPIPWDLDPDYPVWARIWFTHDSTDADTPDWRVDFKLIKKQIAISDAKSSPDLTLTFAAKAVSTTSGALEVLQWEKGSLTFDEDDLAMMIAVECNGLGNASANEIKFMGLELAYTVRATVDVRETTKPTPEDDDTNPIAS